MMFQELQNNKQMQTRCHDITAMLDIQNVRQSLQYQLKILEKSQHEQIEGVIVAEAATPELNQYISQIIPETHLQAYLEQLYQQYRNQNAVLSCTSYQFYQATMSMLVGTCQTHSRTILSNYQILYKLATLKQQFIIQNLPQVKLSDKQLQKRKERSLLPISKQKDVNVQNNETSSTLILIYQNQQVFNAIDEQNLNQTLRLLCLFLSSYEEHFKSLQLRNENFNGYNQQNTYSATSNIAARQNRFIDNAAFVFSRFEQAQTMFNEQLQQLDIKKQIIAPQIVTDQQIQTLIDPIDYLMGPAIKPLDQNVQNFQLCKIYVTKQKLKLTKLQEKQITEQIIQQIALQDKTGEAQKGRPKEDQFQSIAMSRYLTKGELALACLIQVDFAQYIQCKLLYIVNNFSLNPYIFAALGYRPGVCEVFQYLILAQLNGPDKSTLPTIQPTANADQVFNTLQLSWQQLTAYNIFCKRIVSQITMPQQPQTQQQQSPSNEYQIKLNMSFNYMGKPIYSQTSFTVVKQELPRRVQQLGVVPTDLLHQSSEIRDKQTGDVVFDRLKQQLWNCRLFNEYRRYRQLTQCQQPAIQKPGGNQIVIQIPEDIYQCNNTVTKVLKVDMGAQTTKSYWYTEKSAIFTAQQLQRHQEREQKRQLQIKKESQLKDELKLEYMLRPHKQVVVPAQITQNNPILNVSGIDQQFQILNTIKIEGRRGRKPGWLQQLEQQSMLQNPLMTGPDALRFKLTEHQQILEKATFDFEKIHPGDMEISQDGKVFMSRINKKQ